MSSIVADIEVLSSSEAIGPSRVRVPKYLYNLVYDVTSGRAWAHWIENNDEVRAGRPINYEELVRRTSEPVHDTNYAYF